MTFFDRKEEVLEIELTPYGRYLLSLGKMEPVYYSFFDDDIVYDSNYIGYSEDQNETEGRIKETPRVHGQSSFTDIELNSNFVLKHDGRRLQNYFERECALASELGIADYYSDSAPSWDIDVLKGEIKGSTTTYTGSGPNYNILQLNMKDPTYEKIVGTIQEGREPAPMHDGEREISLFSKDYIEIREDFILLEINEINSTFRKENFDIELFEITDRQEGSTLVEGLEPLKFTGRRSKQKRQYAGYFLNLDVDEEIDEKMLCKYKGVDTTKGLYLQRTFECEDVSVAPADQYRTVITDIGEVCD
tara:strand:+ start:12 stop:923 length:912 start_codon:yes stop_codon:yes gene_type:complete